MTGASLKRMSFHPFFVCALCIERRHFVLYTRLNALPHARLGVVAAKRLAPRAVTRNTVKRVTRELFRLTPLPPIDCVVRLSKPVNTKAGPATTARLKRELHGELKQLFASQQADKS